MNTRIKELRKFLNLTQTEFGERIGFSRPMVANLEGTGRAEIKEHTIHLICKEFNVSEDWLRYGKGEMFLDKSLEEELIEFTRDLLIGDDDFKKRLISGLAKLTDEQWEMLGHVIDSISAQK